MSGETSKVWLKYVAPNYWIQERRDVLALYEIQMPELNDWVVGWVEQHVNKKRQTRWRTLTHKLDDWRGDFLSREEAAQDLVANCPVTQALIAIRRSRTVSSGEQVTQ